MQVKPTLGVCHEREVGLIRIAIAAAAFIMVITLPIRAEVPKPIPNSDCNIADYSDFDMAPSFKDSLAVEYPPIARRSGFEGHVKVRIYVNKDGGIDCVKFLKKTHPGLDKNAKSASLGSRLFPAQQNGELVKGYFDVAYNFSFAKWSKNKKNKDKEIFPTIDKTPPMISQIGETTFANDKYPKFEYLGVGFAGDVSLKVYEQCLDQISMKFEDHETTYWVIHWLVWPSTKPNDYLRHSDLEIQTCTKRTANGQAEKGRVFYFLNVNGRYVLKNPDGRVRWS